MKGIYNRNGNLFASWKRDGKTKRYSLLLAEKGNPPLSAKKTQSIAEDLSKILRSLDYGEICREQGENAIKAIAKLPLNVAANALRLVNELAWDKDAGKISIRQYLEGFKGTAGEKLEGCRKTAIKRFLTYLDNGAEAPLDTLTKEQCENIIKKELERTEVGTVKQFRRLISHPFNEAVAEELINRNPISRVNVEKLNLSINPNYKKEAPRVPFTVEDIKILDERLPKEWHDAMLLCILMGGQRKGDVLCLKWEHVNFDEGKNGVVRFTTSKSNGNMPVVVPMLPKLRARLLELQEASKDYPEGYEYVLPSMAYDYINNKGNQSTAFTNLLKALGVVDAEASKKVLTGDRRAMSKKSFHSLRWFVCGTLEAADGVSYDLQRAITAHKNKDVHAGYIAFDEDRRIHALEAIAKACGWM